MVEVSLNINIKLNENIIVNNENINLLQKIKDKGSLNAAAKEMSISYQNAWTLIDQMNKFAPQPLVVKQRGGSGGGGAEITAYGNLILKEFKLIEQKVNQFETQLNAEINF